MRTRLLLAWKWFGREWWNKTNRSEPFLILNCRLNETCDETDETLIYLKVSSSDKMTKRSTHRWADASDLFRSIWNPINNFYDLFLLGFSLSYDTSMRCVFKLHARKAAKLAACIGDVNWEATLSARIKLDVSCERNVERYKTNNFINSVMLKRFMKHKSKARRWKRLARVL